MKDHSIGVIIGLLFDLSNYTAILIGVILTLVLMVTRTSSLLLTRKMDGLSQGLISVVFGKGLGAAAVIIIASQYNIPYADILGKVVYVVIFCSIILSSLRMYWLKHKYAA